MALFFRKILFFLFLIPFTAGAQNEINTGKISGNFTETEALATFLQEAGILGPQFTFSPADVGFDIDTADPKYICCDAVFMEVLRSHLTPGQLLSVTHYTSRRTALPLDSTTTQQAVLYKPFTVGNLLFVLVEQEAGGSRAASLVVLRLEEDHFTLVERSPLCRARRCATDNFRK